MVIKQGGGCDYTIGCGVKVESFGLDDPKQLEEVVIESIQEIDGLSEDADITDIHVYEYTRVKYFDVKDIVSKLREKEEKKEKELADKAEYEEFLRLQRKYSEK